MALRHYDEDWERKKEYLIRPIFAEPPVLSPIPEHQELSSRSLSSLVGQSMHHLSDSPLPELIIEREKRQRHDESKKFYDKLEIKMKKFYRKLFLGEAVDVSDSISENGSSESFAVHSGSFEQHKSENGKEGIDDVCIILNPIEDADQITVAEYVGLLARSDETAEATPVPSSHSSDKHMDVVNRRVEISADLYSAGPSQDDTSNDGVEELISQTFTEQLLGRNVSDDELATTSSNKKSASENSIISNVKETTVVVEKAIVHAAEDKYQDEPETMRNQRPSSLVVLEDSLHYKRVGSSENQCPALNIAYHTMEQMSDSTSTINSSAPMDLESFQYLLPTPMRHKSPIIGWKRPSNDFNNVSTKKKKVDDHVERFSERNDIMRQTNSIKCIQYVEIDSRICSKDVEVQVDYNREMKNVEIETESMFFDKENHREIGIQTDKDDGKMYRNAEIQTENIGGLRDQGTQTGGRFFEYWSIYIGNNIIFV